VESLQRNCECGKKVTPCYKVLTSPECLDGLKKRYHFFEDASDEMAECRIFGELSGCYTATESKKNGCFAYR
jgi:hypothetical protein